MVRRVSDPFRDMSVPSCQLIGVESALFQLKVRLAVPDLIEHPPRTIPSRPLKSTNTALRKQARLAPLLRPSRSAPLARQSPGPMNQPLPVVVGSQNGVKVLRVSGTSFECSASAAPRAPLHPRGWKCSVCGPHFPAPNQGAEIRPLAFCLLPLRVHLRVRGAGAHRLWVNDGTT